jgi:hypothetical protein
MEMKDIIKVHGFVENPKMTASGSIYHGRFTCKDVQWTSGLSSALATFTITADELCDAADNNILWTDQEVQRGIQPGAEQRAEREIPLSAGYPDPRKYIFDSAKANDIAEKLLNGEKLFLNPLIWNLRPGKFEAYWDEANRDIYIYGGRIYLPDSHHRQQAIIKAVKIWRERPADYPKFSGGSEFKIELYFLDKLGEGDYFFDKNQMPKPIARSKAYDLTTQDDLSLLSKKFIEMSRALQGNVNRVTDRLSAKQVDVVTLSTVREMMKTYTGGDSVDAAALDGLANVAAEFFDMLAGIRPELGRVSIEERRQIRNSKLVDAAVMMHGYAFLMRDFSLSRAKIGISEANNIWRSKLNRLNVDCRYTMGDWEGEIFSKKNPLWSAIGVVKPSKDGENLTVLNTGSARSECGRVLRQLTSIDPRTHRLEFLVGR